MATMPYRWLCRALVPALFATFGGCSQAEPTAAANLLDAEAIDAAMAASNTSITNGQPREFSVPTYEGSGQAVHPDVVWFPERWHDARVWLSMTPYPNSNWLLENPSILSNRGGGFNYAVPVGGTNPLVAQRPDAGYNSDPDLAYDAAVDRLVMTYRVVNDGMNSIQMIESPDGRQWTEPVTAVAEPNHSAVSPSVIPASSGTPAMMWYVDAGPRGCHTTSSRVIARRGVSGGAALTSVSWSGRLHTDLAQYGYIVWHLKVRYVEALHLYVALYIAFPDDGRGCGGDDMFLATSTDGIRWKTHAKPLLRRDGRWWTAGAVYRGTFVYHPGRDVLSVWFSAYGSDNRWRLGFVDYRFAALRGDLGSEISMSGAVTEDRARRASNRPVWADAP